MSAVPTKIEETVTAEVVRVRRPGSTERLKLWVYKPSGHSEERGALLWIHGGGFVAGTAEADHAIASWFARELGVVVVSVDYRLAPEEPFPAGLDDCYLALKWLHWNAPRLLIDRTRVAIGGASAGGGLAACLAQLARDKKSFSVAFQLLVYPMLDDRTCLRRDAAAAVWTPRSNRFGWTSYLGTAPGGPIHAPYGVAARNPDLEGLPPAWIGVGDADLFLAENVAYARGLDDSGVACSLHVEAGMAHGGDNFNPGNARMLAFRQRMLDALRPHVAAAGTN